MIIRPFILSAFLTVPVSSQRNGINPSLRGKPDDSKAWNGTSELELFQGAQLDDSDNDSRILSERRLSFVPLDCNEDPCNKGTSTWKSQGYDPNRGTVVIPCGLCITMDYDASDTLVLPHGLDVQGTLDFPDGYKLNLEAPFVRVQGNLNMDATNPVTQEPNVKIVLTGTDSSATAFVPEEPNRFACTRDSDAATPSKCSVGVKPFVVAGGKVNIRGLPEGCPTWVHLEDNIHDSLEPTVGRDYTKLPIPDPQHPNPYCRSLKPYLDENFATDENRFKLTGGYGALFSVTSRGTFKVTGRKDEDDQAPTWDMLHIRDCLIAGQTYLFRARVKLSKEGIVPGTPTTCSTSDVNCIKLESVIRTPTRKIIRRKGYDVRAQGPKYGQWHNFYATFTYDEEELHPDNIYQKLVLSGPEAGVDIEIDNMRFTLPPVNTVPNPDNVCGGNLVLNGDAESDPVHPYPVENYGGYLKVKREADGNKYFHQFGRNWNSRSVMYIFDAPGCLVEKGKYKVSSRIRIHSSTPVLTEIQLRSTFSDGEVKEQVIAHCPGSTKNAWTLCESDLIIDPVITTGDIANIRIQFETIGAPTVKMDVDDLSLVALDGPVSSIVVPDEGVSQCWDTGAKILITSHTLNYDDEQVRQLTSSPSLLGNGMVKLSLDSPIIPPTTRKQTSDFATEVALLSRNFVFEGKADDTDDLIGGHLMVLATPKVQQYLEGVEFRNFGQQGNLGRYPIHFHLCDDVRGAVVSKNTIHESNQRCIVVHGTHNLTVSDNVAYDTQGHCFMTEDGGEVDNVFRGNLGALTRAAQKLVSPDETDHEPSTFWCTNPKNEWMGNVAAGSQENGFWFELRTEVRGSSANFPLSVGMNPRVLPLKNFNNNVAHSNRRHGLRTYPSGFQPDEVAVFNGTKSYKNRQEGIFFHNSENLLVQGGILADNRIQADFDRSDHIQLKDTSLIGVSKQYKEVIQSQSEVPSHSERVIGIQLHSFTPDMDESATLIRDIQFSGFYNTSSDRTALIDIDDAVRIGLFDYWTTLEGVQIDSDVTSPYFDFTRASKEGVSDIYLTDLDSSMRPKGSSAHGTSSIVSNSAEMATFLDTSNCEEFQDLDYMYCSDTCLRSVVYRLSPSGTEDFICRVAERNNPEKFIDLLPKFWYETVDNRAGAPLDDAENTEYRKSRYCAAALPPGNYVTTFLDQNRKEAWPTYVERTIEKAQCEDTFSIDDVQLTIPTVDEETCTNLIVNGDLNDGYAHWFHHESSLVLAVGKGIGGSNAVADASDSSRSSIGQFLDTRCLSKGTQYEVKVWVKLTRSGKPVSCYRGDGCPEAKLRIRTPTDISGLQFDEISLDVTDAFISPYHEDGWNLLQGIFTVDDRIANGSTVWFYVERDMEGVTMFLDNVSVTRLEQNCNQLVLNGDFSGGNSSYWAKNTRKSILDVVDIDGIPALQMMRRSASSESPIQQTRVGCLKEGSRYLAQALVRLQNPDDGSQRSCDASISSGDAACPRMRLRSYVNPGTTNQTQESHDGYGVAFTDHGRRSDGWHTLSGIFTATDSDEQSDKSVLSFEQVHRYSDFAIADVSISPITLNCDELIMNGDAGYDETPRFWRHWINRGGAVIDIVSMDGGNPAFKISNRYSSSDGIHQLVDPRCIESARRWTVTAKMKVLSIATGQGTTCDPFQEHPSHGCPPLRIAGYVAGDRVVNERIYMTNRPTWKPDEFNDFEAEFVVSSTLASCDRVSIGFRSFNDEWDLVVDDIHVVPNPL